MSDLMVHLPFHCKAGVIVLLLILAGCCNEKEITMDIGKLHSPETRARNEGALALARCGSLAEPAVPLLARLLYDESPGVQSSAAYALRQIDTPSARAVMKQVDDQRKRR